MRFASVLHTPFDRRVFLRTTGALATLAACGRRSRADDAASAGGERLHFHSREPNNAEPPVADLVSSWITPAESFYIRSHGARPVIDEAAFTVSIEGIVRRPLQLTPAQLREDFPQASVNATLTCAGNRRREHSETKPVGGVPWDAGAVGNAAWSGARLADVLRRAEILEGARHVWFEGADQVDAHGEKTPFGGSIPLDKALAQDGAASALLAWKMNDRPLTADHGFPVRGIVPGFIGARSVKWLTKIVVSDRPSPNHFLTGAYKLIDEETPAKLAAAEPIFAYPINAAIGVPAAGAKIKAGKVEVAGYALPPGEPGRTIRRVELSTDGGQTWHDAKLGADSSPFCWRLWSAEIQIGPQATQLVVRTTDSSGQRQPPSTPWNVKGYLYNGWHKRTIEPAA